MSRKTAVVLVILILSPLLVYFFWPSDENRIRKLFREGAAAVESENIDAVMAAVSFHYRDEYGLSYLTLKKAMEESFSRWRDISVAYRVTEVRVDGNKASASVNLRVAASIGEGAGYILGDAEKPVAVRFELENERLKWLVIRTDGLLRMQ